MRIKPHGLRPEKHTGHFEAGNTVGDFLGGEAHNGLIAAAGAVDAVINLLIGQVQRTGEHLADDARLPVAEHHDGIHTDILDRQVQRQDVLVAVQHASATHAQFFLHDAHSLNAVAQLDVIVEVQHAQPHGRRPSR